MRMSLRDFCGCARGSSNCMVWWSDADKTCKQIHTLVAFYDGNRTDGRHYRFALPQTFWQIWDFCYFFFFATRDSLSLSLSFLFVDRTKSQFLKCVLNGLLTRCSCNPRFVRCTTEIFWCCCCCCCLFLNSLARRTEQKKRQQNLIRWRSCHSNKFCRMKNWKKKEHKM